MHAAPYYLTPAHEIEAGEDDFEGSIVAFIYLLPGRLKWREHVGCVEEYGEVSPTGQRDGGSH